MVLNYGSLCTGYDGIGMGLALAGLSLRHRFVAEVEPSVSDVLKIEHPNVPNVGDIKAAPWELAPRCQVWSSGDPCQSISVAGRREGRNDPRFLWPWVRTAYRAARPDVIFFENVANIVSHDGGRTLAERLTHLQEDGYGIRWTVLGACAVGAPHHRHRWFAVAARSIEGAARVGGDTAICGAPRSGGRVLLPTPTTADGSGGPGESEKRSGGMNLRTAATLLPTPVARDGEGRSEGSPEYWARRLAESPERAGQGIPLGAVVNLLPTPTTSNAHGNDVNGRGELLLPGVAVDPGRWGGYADAVALWEHVTGIPAPAPAVPGPKGGIRLNPELSEWMMGLRPGLLTGRMSRNAALRAAGNGVVPLAAAAAWKLLTGKG